MVIDEIKVHVTANDKRLVHLLGVLIANIDVLPTIVVKAMEALADPVSTTEDKSNG
jgi:hypothetical protein